MADLVKIPYEGDFADAEQVDIESPEPLSHELTMPDGNVLKLDMTVGNIFRLLHKKDEQGEPIYVFNVLVKVGKKARALDNTLAKE